MTFLRYYCLLVDQYFFRKLHRNQTGFIPNTQESRVIISCKGLSALVQTPSRESVLLAVAEWIEDSALAGAPLASYVANHETYRDPQTGPTVPSAMGQKRKLYWIILWNVVTFLFPVCVTLRTFVLNKIQFLKDCFYACAWGHVLVFIMKIQYELTLQSSFIYS